MKFLHYLLFVSLGHTKKYQITEPSGFKNASFFVKQNDLRMSRDVVYGSHDTDLKFPNVRGMERIDYEQVTNPLGNVSNYLNYGFDWILETWKRFGFEGEIHYILEKDGLPFTIGSLDMLEPDTDETTYFSFKVLQNPQVADYKRHEDTPLDMFGTRNIKGEAITPAPTVKFLRRAVAENKTSEWSCQNSFSDNLDATGTGPISTVYHYYNNCNTPIVSNIKNTLSLGQVLYFDINENLSLANNYKILTVNALTKNVILYFRNLKFNQRTIVTGNGNGYAENSLVVAWGYDINSPINSEKVFQKYQNEDETFTNLDNNPIFQIPDDLQVGMSIWVYFRTKVVQSASPIIGLPQFRAETQISKYTLEIRANVQALDTIVTGVWYRNMMRQCSKNINNLPLDFPRFDAGGQFANQICWNRSLVSQRTDKPFTTSFKAMLGSTVEVNGDYEILEDKIFKGQDVDYYENFENAVFTEIPSKDSRVSWNSKLIINLFKFAYKTFEQFRGTKNTVNDIHTEAVFTIGNVKAKDMKEIEVDLVRSGFSQQTVVDLEIAKPLSSDETDDNVFITDVIENDIEYQEFIIKLNMRNVNGKLTILNRDSVGKDEDAVVNWLAIGIEVGQNVELKIQNTGIYVVQSVTRELLTFTTVGVFEGDAEVSIKNFYSNILWKSRSDEGFTTINDLPNQFTYPNLLYSVARNMKHFHRYIKACLTFAINKKVINKYFKNDPKTETKFGLETVFTVEKGELNYDDLPDALITPKIYDLTVKASFKQVLDYLVSIRIRRGFVRCLALNGKIIKGFVKDLEYSWQTGKLMLTLEEKYENEFLIITFANSVLTVNDIIYNLNGTVDWHRVTNEHFQAFDSNNIAICNLHRFDKIKLNGTVFDSSNALVTALINL
jgi:hypothetical protein